MRTLHLTPEQTIAPDHSHLFAAVGAAMNPKEGQKPVAITHMINTLSNGIKMDFEVKRMDPLFKDQAEYDAFTEDHGHNHVRSGDLSSYKETAIWALMPVLPLPKQLWWEKTALYYTVFMIIIMVVL